MSKAHHITTRVEQVVQTALRCNMGDAKKAIAWLERDLERQEQDWRERNEDLQTKLRGRGEAPRELPRPFSERVLRVAVEHLRAMVAKEMVAEAEGARPHG